MSELNKILGRDFLVAFLLPAFCFLIASFFCLREIWPDSEWLRFDLHDPLKDSTMLALEAFLVGVFLQSVNRELFRFAEGYWGSTIPAWLSYFQRKRFRKLHEDLHVLKTEKGLAQRDKVEFVHKSEYNRLSESVATRFPRREDLVLPTTFGNVVRAYEDYPRAVYGFESINGWSRMQALISKPLNEALGHTRARVDMWLNFCFVTFLTMLEIAILSWRIEKNLSLLLPLASCSLFMLFTYTRARSSAMRYGEQVKAAFDICLPQLAQKLGFFLSDNVEKNRTFWQAYSRLMVYRDSKALEEMFAVGLKACSGTKAESAEKSSDNEDGE